VQRAPGFPCALGFFEGGSAKQSSGPYAARMRTYTCSLFEPATRLGSQVSPCSYGGFNENIEPERNRNLRLLSLRSGIAGSRLFPAAVVPAEIVDSYLKALPCSARITPWFRLAPRRELWLMPAG
jgi:hypothetical protein